MVTFTSYYKIMSENLNINFEVFNGVDDLNDTEKSLYNAAMEIRANAYAPYSNYLVGCAILLDSGEIIKGSNQENAAYPSGLCAERTAIFWMGANRPNANIKKMFVIGGPKDGISDTPAAPCGACRQSILEYESKQENPIEFYFASTNGKTVKCGSMKDLLPFSFDKKFL